jgi:hypothetical protein
MKPSTDTVLYMTTLPMGSLLCSGSAHSGVPVGGFVIAWPFAFAVNRAMIRRGRGHAVAHHYHAH